MPTESNQTCIIFSYVAWMDENAAPGTVVTFENPDLTKVRDEDIGKTGVFALILGNNNGTFEISPNVAEKMADFVVTVRDNALMDYETRKTLEFTVIYLYRYKLDTHELKNRLRKNKYVSDNCSRSWTGNEPLNVRPSHRISERCQRQSSKV